MTHPAAASLDRLESLIDGSIAALVEGRTIDHPAMVEAKGRALLELSRHRTTPAAQTDEALAAQVGRVRAKLAEEERLLSIRLRAAELVSDIVTDALRENEWDGTYGPRPAVPARAEKGE